MKRSFYIYNNGEIHRNDNTLQFTDSEGNKRDIPIEQVEDLYVMSEPKPLNKVPLFACCCNIWQPSEVRKMAPSIILFKRL